MADRVVFQQSARREGVRRVAVVVTDGDSNTDKPFLESRAQAARDNGMYLFAVGVGNTTSMDELRLIASKPYYHFVHMLADYDKLATSWHTVGNDVYEGWWFTYGSLRY